MLTCRVNQAKTAKRGYPSVAKAAAACLVIPAWTRTRLGTVAPALSELGGIAALTGIEPIDDVLIPAALAGGDLPLADQLHYLIWFWAIAHQITQAGDLFNPLTIDIRQHGLGGGEVGMQARDDGVAHGFTGLG